MNENHAGEWKWKKAAELADSLGDSEAIPQANALLLAGYTFEIPSVIYGWRYCSNVMAWHWRAPAKPGRKKGRRYMSTLQAFNAMQRAK